MTLSKTNYKDASKIKEGKEPLTIYVDPAFKQAYITYSVLEKYTLCQLLKRSFLHYKKHKAAQLARQAF